MKLLFLLLGILPLCAQTSVMALGAKGDVRTIADASLTAGSQIVTSVYANWASADIGKYVSCEGAGPTPTFGGGYYPNQGLVGIILAVDGMTATISASAANSVSAAKCRIGTDDTLAFQAGFNLALANGQVALYVPPGAYFVQPTLAFYSNTDVHADTRTAVLYKLFPSTDQNVSGTNAFFRPATWKTAMTSNVSFSGLILDGNIAGNDHSPRINANSDGADSGFLMAGVDTYRLQDNTVLNLYTDAVYNTSVNNTVAGTESIHGWIVGNKFVNIGRVVVANSAMIDLKFLGNSIDTVLLRGPAIVIDVEPFAGMNVKDFTVGHNRSTNTRGAYAIQGGGIGPTDFTFADNQWTAMGNGILAAYGAYIGAIRVLSSTNEYFAFSASGVSPLDAMQITSAGDQVFITNIRTSNAHTGLHIAGTNVFVRGGHLKDSWLESLQVDANASGSLSGITLDTPSKTNSGAYPAYQTLAGGKFAVDHINVTNIGVGSYSFQTTTNAGSYCANCILLPGIRGTINALAPLGTPPQ